MSARDLSLTFPALKSSEAPSLGAPLQALPSREAGVERIEPTTLVYRLIAYVTKEVLDDASEDYGRSPIGAHLEREPLARNSRSSSPTIPASSLLSGSSANLRYRVRDNTSLTDLWSGRASDPSGFSLNPKIGAGKAGVVLMLRW